MNNLYKMATFATLICVLMISCAMFAESSDAADYETVVQDGITYKLLPGVGGGENTAEATSVNASLVPAELTIPKNLTHEGKSYHVTALNFTLNGNVTSLTTLTIESNPSLTIKQKFARNLTSLTTVTLGDNVPVVSQMFQGCKNLTSVSFKVDNIGNQAFANSGVTDIDLSKVKTIGSQAFMSCINLTSVSLDSIDSVGQKAFQGCSKLTNLSLGNDLKSIGSNAFTGTAVPYVFIPAGLTDITVGTYCIFDDFAAIAIDEDNPAFASVDGVIYSKDLSTIIYYPRNFTSLDGTFTTSANIGPYAFYNTLLNTITIQNGAETIGENAFRSAKYLRSVTIADSVESIGDSAFYQCSALESVRLPAGMTSIGKSIFSQCSMLTSINIPENLESIGNNTFSECSSLAISSLPATLTTIGNNTFSGCSSLAISSLPATLTTIGNSAFSGCTALNISEIPASVTEIGTGAFNGSGIVSIRVGIGDNPVKLAGTTNLSTFGGNALKNIYLDNIEIQNVDYVSTIVNSYTLESFELGSRFSYFVWDEQTGVGYNIENKTAYLLKPGVKKLVIPLVVEKVYGPWWPKSNITEIDYIGDATREITFDTGVNGSNGASDSGIFRYCYDLVKVRLPTVTFGQYDCGTFFGCTSLREVYIENAVVIPVASKFDMFYMSPESATCPITKVVIGNGTSVDARSALTSYLELPDNLTKLNLHNKAKIYDIDGTTLLNVNSDIGKLKGKTLIWDGTAVGSFKILADTDKVITLDYNGIKVYTYAKADVEFDPSTVSHSAYSATGWYKDSDMTLAYTPGAVSSDMTLFAGSELKTVIVTVKTEMDGAILAEDLVMSLNGVIINSGDSVPYNSRIDLSWTPKTGHVVTAKYKNADTESYLISNAGDSTSSSTSYPLLKDTEFWVVFKISTYTLSYNTAGADPISSVTAEYGKSIDAPADPVREGYKFVGWSQEIPETMPNTDIEFIAMWCPDKFPIILNTMGGTIEGGVTTIVKTYYTMFTDLPVPTKTGYAFVGWFTEADGGEKIQYDDMFTYTDGFPVYAHWMIDKFTIQFDTDGGSSIGAIEQYYGTPVTTPVNPVKEGYTFIGWNTSVPTSMPGEDIVLKALWAVKVTPAGDVDIDLPANGNFVMPDTQSQSVKVDIDDRTSVKVMDATGITSKVISVSVDPVINPTNVFGTAYEFILTADGSSFNGKMQVTLPYASAEGKVPVVHYWNGLTTVMMKVISYDNDSVTFETDHNSTYIVASENAPAPDVEEEKSSPAALYAGIAIVAVVIGVLLGYFIARNRSA